MIELSRRVTGTCGQPGLVKRLLSVVSLAAVSLLAIGFGSGDAQAAIARVGAGGTASGTAVTWK